MLSSYLLKHAFCLAFNCSLTICRLLYFKTFNPSKDENAVVFLAINHSKWTSLKFKHFLYTIKWIMSWDWLILYAFWEVIYIIHIFLSNEHLSTIESEKYLKKKIYLNFNYTHLKHVYQNIKENVILGHCLLLVAVYILWQRSGFNTIQ